MIGTKFYKSNLNLDEYKKCSMWCTSTQQGRIEDKGAYYECVELEIPEMTEAEIQQMMTDIVQNYMDTTAQTRGYDNIHTAASYSNSTDAIFRAEGQACLEWRDKVWRACYTILEEVQLGSRPIPSPEELFELLPKLNW